MIHRHSPRLTMCLAALVAATGASAQDSAPAAAAPPAAEQGLIPVPDYGGDWLERSRLAGDFGGRRSALAEKGVQFDVGWVQTAQSVVDGGRGAGSKYGGSLDYLLLLDLHRMGLIPGALLKARAETRYGESVNDRIGAILPVSTDGFFPLTTPADDAIPITVTNLLYYQFLSESFGLFAGKFDGLDSDLNEFASGRGNSQFLNMQLLLAGPLALLPYATVGAGAVAMPTRRATLKTVLFSLSDSSTTTGLADCQGWVWASEGSFQHRLGDLPGGTNVGGFFAWDTRFFDFDGRFAFQRGEGLEAPSDSDTWVLYWSGWQYLYAPDGGGEGPLALDNGEPDLRGIGLFWRTALADDDVNPFLWSVSGGVGGKGLIPTRERDHAGLGYYYNRAQDTRLDRIVDIDDSTQGLEAFYNLALTPAVNLTLDAQFIDPLNNDLDTAVVLGARLAVRF